MKPLKLKRWAQVGSYGPTMGTLIDIEGRFICHTLELPWADNSPNESCILPGKYRVEYMRESGSGKYRDVYWLRAVPGRSAILFHKGNSVADTLGCILPGMRINREGDRVLDSAGGMESLHRSAGRRSFDLIIEDYTGKRK